MLIFLRANFRRLACGFLLTLLAASILATR